MSDIPDVYYGTHIQALQEDQECGSRPNLQWKNIPESADHKTKDFSPGPRLLKFFARSDPK